MRGASYGEKRFYSHGLRRPDGVRSRPMAILDESASDIRAGTWIDRWAPSAARPYLRLARVDRPIGTWLLLLPCWWGAALASLGWPDPWLLFLFAVGAFVMRSAGCTINDIIDRNVDAEVARTATRPIARGEIGLGQAFLFLALQLGIGLLVLLQFNAFTVMLAIASLPIVAVYPFMKRFTHWPQLVLGLAFNWGTLVGWSSVTGDVALPAVWLYAAGIFWTLGYDTIYAHQDKEDDRRLGLRSTAILFGVATRPWLFGFYIATILLLALAGGAAELGLIYFGGLAASAAHLAWQAANVEFDAPKDCLAKFRSNRIFGLIVFAGIALGRAFP